MKHILLAIALALFVTGCASDYREPTTIVRRPIGKVMNVTTYNRSSPQQVIVTEHGIVATYAALPAISIGQQVTMVCCYYQSSPNFSAGAKIFFQLEGDNGYYQCSGE